MFGLERVQGDTNVDRVASFKGAEYLATSFVWDFGDIGFDMLMPAVIADEWGVEYFDGFSDTDAAYLTKVLAELQFLLVIKLLHVKWIIRFKCTRPIIESYYRFHDWSAGWAQKRILLETQMAGVMGSSYSEE